MEDISIFGLDIQDLKFDNHKFSSIFSDTKLPFNMSLLEPAVILEIPKEKESPKLTCCKPFDIDKASIEYRLKKIIEELNGKIGENELLAKIDYALVTKYGGEKIELDIEDADGVIQKILVSTLEVKDGYKELVERIEELSHDIAIWKVTSIYYRNILLKTTDYTVAGALDEVIELATNKGVTKVETIAERDALEAENGDLVYVNATRKVYIYTDGDWRNIGSDDAFPILTSAQEARKLESGELPNDYLLLEDIREEILHRDALDVLFSAIRSLLAEVSKLKTSFLYGINSCINDEVASSRILDELSDVEEEEPLWAVQESELSGMFSLQFNASTELEPREGAVITPEASIISIQGIADFICENHSETRDMKLITDPKVLFYLTASEKTVTITLENEDGEEFELDLNSLVPAIDATYAFLLIISKKVTDKITEEKYGENFVWLVALDLINNNVLYERYINPKSMLTSSSPLKLDESYYLSSVSLDTLKISKFDLYTKYLDFSDHVEAVKPSDVEDIKYKAAHITIRSVSTSSDLDKLIRKLQNNELVYVTKENSLYIIYGGAKHRIGSTGPEPEPEDKMTVEELINNLREKGLISLTNATYDSDGKLTSVDSVDLAKIASLSLINEHTRETVTYTVDSEGDLVGNLASPENGKFSFIVDEIYKSSSLKPIMGMPEGELTNLISSKGVVKETFSTLRGFIARVHGDNVSGRTSDTGLKSDRVKIGAYYSPLSNATTHGCTHAYVELENSSLTDFYLDGCYLHYAGAIIGVNSNGDKIATLATYHLPLSGKLPAGGTYLVRGFNYVLQSSPTAFIKVNTYDIEWYVNLDSVTFTAASGYDYSGNFGKLLKLDTVTNETAGGNLIIYGLALTYGKSDLTYNTAIVSPDVTAANGDYLSVMPYLIDSCNMFITSASLMHWNPKKSASKIDIIETNPGNCIFKNMFELDPAKQAFQSYSLKDSSRFRGVTAADYQILELNKEYILFPNSNDVFPVAKYTPKASFENKNVITDKTSLDIDKPNMPTVSFGINQATTRCFNWISVGTYDEFVWLRKHGEDAWTRIQSYWGNNNDSSSEFVRKEFEQVITYGDSLTTTIREVVYANPEYKNVFPGCNISYTAHKCVVDITATLTDSPIIYDYIVGRSNSDHSPMEGHVSDIQTFTLYPDTYTPVIYQISDQLGFHWAEYQAWAAAADVINNKIKTDQAANHIIPILVNTGDMTLNGTRINEWLDYYNAGRHLFDHLEQVNVVGNNDLGNVDETSLGTGDDPGKSNPHFYNICYCYEVPIMISDNSVYTPIYCGEYGPKYIPSMYYLDFEDFRIFLGNTEITTTAGSDLFGTGSVDLYTGLTWKSDEDNTSDVTTNYVNAANTEISISGNSYSCNHYIYEIWYKWMKNTTTSAIFACHEMPFTVVTQDNLTTTRAYSDRSISVTGSTGLIGCHCNRPNFLKGGLRLEGAMKIRNKGTYWLSRLLEDCGIKYCIGGHKHTYACTWPVRENYYYNNGTELVSSLDNGKMTMPESLADDEVYFLVDSEDSVVIATSGNDTMSSQSPDYATQFKNLTKFPIVSAFNFNNDGTIKGNYSGETTGFINGVTKDESSDLTYVIYFMLQATGFKLKSNKELPGTLLKFSQIIPCTDTGNSKPNVAQIYPMFAKIILDPTAYNSGLDIKLMAISHIVPNDVTVVLNLQSAYDSRYHCTETPELLYFNNSNGYEDIPYGHSVTKPGDSCWSETESSLNLHLQTQIV